MYSVVLMAALSTGSAGTECCFGNWCCAHGYPNTGYGSGCYGCYGGWYGGEYGGWFGGISGYHGAYGGCYGGCYGVYGCQGCYGGWSCYGSNYGGCYGYGGGYDGGVYGPYNPMPPAGDKQPEILPIPKDKEEARAKVVVEVPAQAKLYIDDQLMPNKAGKRTFVTPPLQAGQTYYYDVKLVTVQGGQEVAQTTRVVLRPGEVQTASFGNQPGNGIVTASAGKR